MPDQAFGDAHGRLPRLFELLHSFPTSKAQFAQRVGAVPPWPFLRWLPQALAHLPVVAELQDPLTRLADSFPQALIWPLQLARSDAAPRAQNVAFDALWKKLREICEAPTRTAVDLTKGLEFLMHPNKRFETEFKNFRGCFLKGQWTDARNAWRTLWEKCLELDPCIAGSAHVSFAKRMSEILKNVERRQQLPTSADLPDLASLDPEKRKVWFHGLRAEIEPVFARAEKTLWVQGKEELQLFTPWLARFDGRSSWLGSRDSLLEVPGQYGGLQRPDASGHTRIIRFAPGVLIMGSKQKPKRVVILGDDERDHPFLVKGGEDVRLDARIEQLFDAVNGLLGPVATPGLRVRTYSVVPVLPDLGIIEWAANTKPLKAVVMEMAKVQSTGEIEAQKMRFDWLSHFAKGAKDQYEQYQRVHQCTKADIQIAFGRQVAALPEGAKLKAYLMRTAIGPEALWYLRQRFASSLAAYSIVGYLLGIGDRHLENSLLCTQTAELVPIDFGYSFGVGALLPIPELVPFRLTGFLTSVLQPLAGEGADGTFRQGAITTLSRCRANPGALEDACAIFIREPLLDWAAESKRRNDVSIEFLPRRRLKNLAERLRGEHPAKVLMRELADNETKWVKEMRAPALETIVSGLDYLEPLPATPEQRARAQRAELYKRGGPLTVLEQVDCLIRQASDPNILGRMWQGWAPEI